MQFDTFINKDMFANLAGCIIVVEACTESAKMLLGDLYGGSYWGLWIAFFFSILVSAIRFVLDGDSAKEKVIMILVNIIPIFLGSVGIYQIAKPILKSI